MGKQAEKFAAAVSADCGGLVSVNDDGKKAGIDPATITILITDLVIPLAKNLIEKCRAKRQQQQQDTPQQQIRAAHNSPTQRAKNIDLLTRSILAECKRRTAEEIRKARAAKLPADIGRYQMDGESAYRIADKMHGKFANSKPADADALCAEFGVV